MIAQRGASPLLTISEHQTVCSQGCPVENAAWPTADSLFGSHWPKRFHEKAATEDQRLCHENDFSSTRGPAFTSAFVWFRGLVVKNSNAKPWIRHRTPVVWGSESQGPLGFSLVINLLPSSFMRGWGTQGRTETCSQVDPLNQWGLLGTPKVYPHSNCDTPEPSTPSLLQLLESLKILGPSDG